MRYFMIEGTLIENPQISDELMQQHMNYTQKAMEQGKILFSGLKKSMDGALFVMKAESVEEIENYLNQEPFGQQKIQSYRIIEFDAHYVNETGAEWF